MSPTHYVGTASLTLYGGLIGENADGDPIVVTGTANIAVYEVNAAITIPDDATVVPSPRPC